MQIVLVEIEDVAYIRSEAPLVDCFAHHEFLTPIFNQNVTFDHDFTSFGS